MNTTPRLTPIATALTLLAMIAFPVTASAQAETRKDPAGQPTGNPGRNEIQKKFKSIILPSVEWEDESFDEAVDFLRTQSKAHDVAEQDEAKKGVKIHVEVPRGTVMPRVSLKLQNVTLGEALARLMEISKTSARLDSETVILSPKPLVAGTTPAPEVVAAAQRTTIDMIDIADQPLDSVVELLNRKSAAGKGPQIVIGEGLDPKTTVRELRLRASSLAEVISFIARDIRCGMKTDEGKLVLIPN